jgi:hypothetical protein
VRTARQDAQGAGWGWYAGNKNEASQNTHSIVSYVDCTRSIANFKFVQLQQLQEVSF